MTRTRMLVPLVAAAGALAVAAPAAQAAIDWQIGLHHAAGFPKATGSAQYQRQAGQRELQVEVEHLARLAGKRVYFWANGARFGSAVVTARGVTQIDRNTELHQRVPAIVHGSHVAVRTHAGTKIAGARF